MDRDKLERETLALEKQRLALEREKLDLQKNPWRGFLNGSQNVAETERERLERERLELEKKRLAVEQERLALEEGRQREAERQAFRAELDRIGGSGQSLDGSGVVLPRPRLPWETPPVPGESGLERRIKEQLDVLAREFPSFRRGTREYADYERWIHKNRKTFEDLCNLAEADPLVDIPRFIWNLVTKRDTLGLPRERRSAPPADFSRAISRTPLSLVDGTSFRPIVALRGILLPPGATLSQQEAEAITATWDVRFGGSLFDSGVIFTEQEIRSIRAMWKELYHDERVPLTHQEAEAIVAWWRDAGTVVRFTLDFRLSCLPEAIARQVWVYRAFNDIQELNDLKTSKHTGANIPRYRIFVAISK
jgi:hypothetical protein